MSVANIRTQIAAVMMTVANIGVVHQYERYASNIAQLKALYFSAPHDQIRGWNVRRVNTKETGQIQQRSVEIIRWRLSGYMGLNDALSTELTMDSLIEGLRDAFKANRTLNGAVHQISMPTNVPAGAFGESALQLVDFGPVMFADVLCHGVRLELNTVRYL